MTDATADDPPDEHSGRRVGNRVAPAAVIRSGTEAISVELALTVFRQMVRTRALEERSIKMSKSGEAYFWIGGPGEEAFNVCLGMQVKTGPGPAYDYLHLHYRSAGLLLAMGMPMVDHVRTLAMTATDRHSMGRNFVGHYAVPEWNVVPVTSVIEVQMVMAPGTALVQKRHGGDGLTIAVSGDAGTAEGDFESCLLWSSRPGHELPVLAVVTNNGWGISTAHGGQHAVRHIADRAGPYGIRHETLDGNDPVACWHGIARAMRYVRTQRRPFLLEALVSRLHGHSSSSGAQRQHDQPDPLARFEQRLIDAGASDAAQVRELKDEARAEAGAAVVQAVGEPKPTKLDVYTHTYAASEVDAVYPGITPGCLGHNAQRKRKAKKSGGWPVATEPLDIEDRTFRFVLRIVRLCRCLDERPGVKRTLGNQLLRSGTSVGANGEEARAAYSRAEFVSKMGIALKEAREARYWLRILIESELVEAALLNPLLSEATEVMKVIGAITSKARRSAS